MADKELNFRMRADASGVSATMQATRRDIEGVNRAVEEGRRNMRLYYQTQSRAANRGFHEQAVRDEMAARIKAMRAEAMKVSVADEVNKRLFGNPTTIANAAGEAGKQAGQSFSDNFIKEVRGMFEAGALLGATIRVAQFAERVGESARMAARNSVWREGSPEARRESALAGMETVVGVLPFAKGVLDETKNPRMRAQANPADAAAAAMQQAAADSALDAAAAAARAVSRARTEFQGTTFDQRRMALRDRFAPAEAAADALMEEARKTGGSKGESMMKAAKALAASINAQLTAELEVVARDEKAFDFSQRQVVPKLLARLIPSEATIATAFDRAKKAGGELAGAVAAGLRNSAIASQNTRNRAELNTVEGPRWETTRVERMARAWAGRGVENRTTTGLFAQAMEGVYVKELVNRAKTAETQRKEAVGLLSDIKTSLDPSGINFTRD